MRVIHVNERAYAPDDPVTWEDAIEAGGFYFSRARYLGIPRPPAILFDEGSINHLLAMGRYHELFREAEAKAVDDEPDPGMSSEREGG